MARAVELRPDVLELGRVSRDTWLRWADVEISHADHTTGRGVSASNDRVAALVGCSVRTVQRCRAVAIALGVYRVVLPGRRMSQVERIRARCAGLKYVGLTNIAAWTIPAWLRDTEPAAPSAQVRARPVDSVAPPVGTHVVSPLQHSCGSSSGATAPRAAALRARRRRPPAGMGLAEQLTTTTSPIWFLRGTSAWRSACALTPYARAGWTPRDLAAAIEGILADLGWDCPATAKIAPHGLLAWFLRRIPPDASRGAHSADLTPHCGSCSPTRRLEDPDTGADLGPCPTCHPSAARSAA